MTPLRPIGFDHVVLVVADVERSLVWYLDEVGAEPVRVEEWRAGQAPFPSFRLSGESIIDLIPGERSGQNVDHLCIVVEPIDLAEVAASGRFEVLDGPDTRYGAQGNGTSLYVRDPDGNTVELRHYGRA
ncbi:MAG: glyoxalase [Actinomycetia bacterium]|nr:glyoxalase [Actinomycetes bacterium]